MVRLLQKPAVASAALGAILAGLAMAVVPRPAFDMDAWWIAATGRIILATGALPRVNLFSFTEPLHPWVMHEWLYAVLFARGLSSLGPAFLTCFAFASACAVAAVLLAETLAPARHPASAALLAGLALGGTLDRLDSPRPLYASIVFALIVTPLALRPRFSRASLATAVITELVWANAHGSFPLGVIVLAFGAALRERDRPRRALAAALALAVTLVNPHGARIYALVSRYARGGDEASALIRAHVGGFMPLWRAPPAFVDPPIAVAFGAVVLAAAASLASRRHRARGAVALLMAGLGIVHVRHLALGTLVGCALVAPAIDDRFAAVDAPPVPGGARAWRLLLALGPAVVGGALAIAAAARSREPVDWIAPLLGAPELLRLAAKLPPDARVYTQFRSTGLLMWLEAPRGVRVLYDARNDCYSAALVTAGFALDEGARTPAELRALLERYGTDHVLLLRASPIARALEGAPGWVTAARDGAWAMYARWGP